jgi:hypothetical protein
MKSRRRRNLIWALALLACPVMPTQLAAQTPVAAIVETPSSDVLTLDQWQRVDDSVDRALAWLASEQNRDGSFPTMPQGQPGVTGLCVLAFLAQGHLPGEGPYGETVQRGLDYIISCQQANGIVALLAPRGPQISRAIGHEIGYTICYNHAIGGLVLCEAFAMEGANRAQAVEPVIEKALRVTLEMQNWPKDLEVDKGGWRYLDDYEQYDSDLSITGWQLMFLRSAKNAGFEVEPEPINRGVEYVRRCFRQDLGRFTYKLESRDRSTRAMAGAGILALAHAGLHNTPEAQRAGDWLLQAKFDRYNSPGSGQTQVDTNERYHYGLLTCCQAMYQLGGRHWAEFYPRTVEVLLNAQAIDGSWERENHHNDNAFGNAYTTAVGVLALGAPNQLLPIFQR